MNDATGRPGARVVGISYIADGVTDPASRPVLFAFNGGPISPSNVLHMGMLGPKRVAIPDDVSADPSTFKLVDNPYTVLDVADIVLIDPASTGFSRVVKGVDPKSYFSVHADAQQMAQFIVEWSKKHGRLSSPKYVLGESYGTMRAAAVANQLQKLPQPVPLSGVILLGQALNIIEFSQRPANTISYAVSLPTLAATAWSHGKANTHGKSFDAFMDEVWAFARNDYLRALFQGQSLDPDTRRAIAEKLADFTRPVRGLLYGARSGDHQGRLSPRTAQGQRRDPRPDRAHAMPVGMMATTRRASSGNPMMRSLRPICTTISASRMRTRTSRKAP